VQRVALGDFATGQAVTRVNAEQASKLLMREPSQLRMAKAAIGKESSDHVLPGPAGVVATACPERSHAEHGKPHIVVVPTTDRQPARARPDSVGWRRGP
jgi:hypothetical protein